MPSSTMNPKVDFYFDKEKQWKQEILQLRDIVLSNNLTEELKWGVPCYTMDNHNVVLIHTFKAYCALLFFKGALLHDPKSILVQQTKNVQAARQVRFTDLQQIEELKDIIKSYISEAVEIEKAGRGVPFKTAKEFDIPDEFKVKLDTDRQLKQAFDALSPGRQKAYLLYFSGAKQPATRQARVEKYIPVIKDGKGLNDQA